MDSPTPDPRPGDAPPTAPARGIDMSVELPATPDAVWRALTDPAQLASWFPLSARVTPGAGGSIFLSWGPGCEGEAPITIWEPGRRLQWSEGAGPTGLPIVVDYQIEARAGGTTVLRLVHSGFAAGAEWDAYYDAVEGGWTYFLWNLRHYLSRHPGAARSMAWDRRRPGRPRADVWRRLVGGAGEGGYAPTVGAAPRQAGDPFVFPLGGGQPPLRGTAAVVRERSFHFAGVVEALSDAVLFVELEAGPEDGYHCGVWLSTYGLPAEQVARLQAALSARMDATFGAPLAV